MLELYTLIGFLSLVFGAEKLSVTETDPPISVIHFFNEKTLTYDIYCENITKENYSVELGFETLSGLRPSTPYPLRKTVEPGRHLLMRLIQKEMDTRGNFKIALSYRKGNLVYNFPKKFPYLIPLKAGSTTRLLCSDSVRANYPLQQDSTFYIKGFYAQSRDTIYAARRGVVSKIQNYAMDSSLVNRGIGYFLDIQQPDGSYGRYDGISADSSFVEVGDIVEAGDPIARVREDNRDSTYFSFQVFYYDEKVITDPIGPKNTQQIWLPIKFHSMAFPTNSHYYIVEHPEEIITQEMSKRDLRRWSRKGFLKWDK